MPAKVYSKSENEATKAKESALSTTSVESSGVSKARAQAGADRCEAEASRGVADGCKAEVSARGTKVLSNSSFHVLTLKTILLCQRPVVLKRDPQV